MLELHLEELPKQLSKGLSEVYLLLGNDSFLLQRSQNIIRKMAAMWGFYEHHNIQIDSFTDWKALFQLCQTIGLFSPRKILVLFLPEKGLNSIISAQLCILKEFLHRDLLLLICGNKLTKSQEKSVWLSQLAEKAVLVKCQTPELEELEKWVKENASLRNLQLDEAACQLLCSFYEGNLLGLTQILDQLALVWPDGKLTLPRIKKVVDDIARFTPFHLVDALFSGKRKRAFRILQKFRIEGSDPTILLRILQRELLLLIFLKRESITTTLPTLFNKHRIFKNRWAIVKKMINRLSYEQFRQAIQILTRVELILKQDSNYCNQLVWNELERISLLLCHEIQVDVFIDVQ